MQHSLDFADGGIIAVSIPNGGTVFLTWGTSDLWVFYKLKLTLEAIIVDKLAKVTDSEWDEFYQQKRIENQ